MPAVRQFVVGDKDKGADFSPAEIEALVYKIAIWFRSPECPRSYEDPVAEAKRKVRQCLLGLNDAEEQWGNCPADFGKRVKVKTNFDIVNDRGLYTKQTQYKRVGGKGVKSDAEKRAKAAMKEIDPVAGTFDQDAFRLQVESDIFASFPELDNPAHRPNVRSLSGVYAQREVIDRELAMGVSASKREQLLKSLKLIEDMGDGTMRRLGIHPDQVRKKLSDKGASSVGDLAAQMDADLEFPQREKLWAQQEALQLWWMSEHANGNKTGPQLNDFEIWHLTRSRPIKFKCRCGIETLVIEGFEPKELRDYLLAQGVLVEEPLHPSITSAADLKGLATFSDEPA